MSPSGVFQAVWSASQSIVPEDPAAWAILAELGGTLLADAWVPLRFESDSKLVVDRPWLGEHVLVLGERGITAIGEHLLGCGELLRLEHQDGPLWLFNPKHVLDALGLRSEVLRFGGTGNIKSVPAPDFRAQVIDGIDLFKVAGYRGSALFYSARMVALIEDAGLSGPRFRRVDQPNPDDPWRKDNAACRADVIG